jgi:quercetin dioxygenase-like cupin family protein
MDMRNTFNEGSQPSAGASRNDPVKVAPQVYKVLLENDRVRVLEITMRPGGQSPMHWHPGYVIYGLSGGKARFRNPEGKTAEMEVKQGEVVWRPSEFHAVENTGNTRIEVLNIELKQQAGRGQSAAKIRSEMDPVKVAPNIYRTVLENDCVRVCRVTARPGEKASMHSHPDHLAYFLVGGRVTFTYPDGRSEDVDVKTGAAAWIPAGDHESENSGDADVEVLIVEMK